MTRIKARAPWWEFRPLLMQREDFQAGANMRGLHVASSGWRGTGSLPPLYDSLFERGVREGWIDYVVYSYDTPIAWHVKRENGTDEWFVPEIRYSQTTTQHQHHIRAALHKEVSVTHVVLNWPVKVVG